MVTGITNPELRHMITTYNDYNLITGYGDTVLKTLVESKFARFLNQDQISDLNVRVSVDTTKLQVKFTFDTNNKTKDIVIHLAGIANTEDNPYDYILNVLPGAIDNLRGFLRETW